MYFLKLPKFDSPEFSLPKFNLHKLKNGKDFHKKPFIVFVILISFISGMLGGIISGDHFYSEVKDYLSKLNIIIPETKIIENNTYIPQTTREELIIRTVEQVSPSVVSIVITKEMPTYESYYMNPFGQFGDFIQIPQYRQNGTEEIEVGGGTGFIISSDGMILTNNHVVSDQDANYTVLNNEGEEFSAKVLARDPIRDLAVIQIQSQEKFIPVKLGDSSKLKPGQTIIAIGNALGKFKNTVSVGVISGLGRTITASDGDRIELLEDVIQVDAAINKGNSGGPLLNLNGEVIGVNVAMSEIAENIGFAIAINNAKEDINQVKNTGKIVYPFLGVRYVLITPFIAEDNDLSVENGAWIIKGDKIGEIAIISGSPADKAGLKEGDIIIKIGEGFITKDNSLANLIRNYSAGDEIILTILRDNQEKQISIILDGKNPSDF